MLFFLNKTFCNFASAVDEKQDMPTNKNAIVRYKYLDKMLSDRYHYYDIHDLTDKCNEWLEFDGFQCVSQRCIEKDINELSFSPFSADIERYRYNGKRCIRYKDPTFSIFNKKLSEDEKNLLAEVLNTIGQFEGLDNFDWIDKLKQRLNIEEHKKIISFSNNPYLRNSNLLGVLFSVISNKLVINLTYHSFKNEQERNIVVYPYLLKQWNNRWYLIASAEDGFILNFALDRIDKVKPLLDRKYKDIDCDLEERFEDIIGVTIPADKKVEEILFWISDKSFPYIDTKPLHASQVVINNDNELRNKYPQLHNGKFIKLNCMINYELFQLFMSHLEDIIILTPTHLQDKIHNTIKTKNEEYFSLRK